MSKDAKPIISSDSIEDDNPIGLDRDVAAEIVPALDRLQATHYTLFHQYQKHHWLVEGPQHLTLHEYLQTAYEGIQTDTDDLAERLTYLGGVPTSGPAAFEDLSFVEMEPEGQFPVRDMLRRDLDAEKTIARQMRSMITHVTKLGDFGTERLLKKILTHVAERAHNLDHFLGHDSLEDGRESYQDQATQVGA